ncbi:uncharacterized protein METZ01_LOCUS269747, partial [marine metagenome]
GQGRVRFDTPPHDGLLLPQEEDETTARTLTWTIQELSNARSLANEGEAMGTVSVRQQ